MSNRDSAVIERDIDKARTEAMRFQNAGNPLTFVASSIDGVEKAYGSLATEKARREFWDRFSESMEKHAPGGWASVYHGLELLRKSEWYWKPKGYPTFNDFLRAEMAHSFEQLDALERRYHFAVTSCPRLFKLSADKADAEIERLRKTEALKANGRPRNPAPKKKEQGFSAAAAVDVDAQTEEFRRGYKSYGSSHHFYRFARLKRDAPKVAARVLAGEFTKARKCGTPFVDLAAAEIEAERVTRGKFVAKPRASRQAPPIVKAQRALAKLSTEEWNAIVAWMNARK